jgi:hypothetical protein
MSRFTGGVMRFKLVALATCAALVTVASGAVGVGREKVEAGTSTLSIADVASVLGIRSWGYTLKFEQRISQVTVRPCELRRRADGGWDQTYLSPGLGCGVGDLTEVDVKILSQHNTTDGGFWLKVGPVCEKDMFTTRPDFDRTYSSPTAPRWVNGCLALAIEEENPRAIRGREQDMVRVVALEITTE